MTSPVAAVDMEQVVEEETRAEEEEEAETVVLTVAAPENRRGEWKSRVSEPSDVMLSLPRGRCSFGAPCGLCAATERRDPPTYCIHVGSAQISVREKRWLEPRGVRIYGALDEEARERLRVPFWHIFLHGTTSRLSAVELRAYFGRERAVFDAGACHSGTLPLPDAAMDELVLTGVVFVPPYPALMLQASLARAVLLKVVL